MGNNPSLQTKRRKSNLIKNAPDSGALFLLYLFIKNFFVFLIEFLEGSVFDFFAHFCHHFVIEPKIMENAKAHSKALVRFYKVADISFAVTAAGGTAAIFIDGCSVIFEFFCKNSDFSFPGKNVAVLGVS